MSKKFGVTINYRRLVGGLRVLLPCFDRRRSNPKVYNKSKEMVLRFTIMVSSKFRMLSLFSVWSVPRLV